MKYKQGLTLIEVLVSGAILSIVGIAALGIMNQAIIQRARNEAITQLTLFSHRQLEIIQAEGQKGEKQLPEEITCSENPLIKGTVQYGQHPQDSDLQIVEITTTYRGQTFEEKYLLTGVIVRGRE